MCSHVSRSTLVTRHANCNASEPLRSSLAIDRLLNDIISNCIYACMRTYVVIELSSGGVPRAWLQLQRRHTLIDFMNSLFRNMAGLQPNNCLQFEIPSRYWIPHLPETHLCCRRCTAFPGWLRSRSHDLNTNIHMPHPRIQIRCDKSHVDTWMIS